MVTTLQQQLGDVAAAKSSALSLLATIDASGAGPNYSIAGKAASESLDFETYRAGLVNRIKDLAETELLILDELQKLQPFTVVERVRVGGSLIGPGHGRIV